MRLEPRVHVSAESAYDLEIATTLPERVGSGRCLLAGPVMSMGQNESVSALKSGGEVRPNWAIGRAAGRSRKQSFADARPTVQAAGTVRSVKLLNPILLTV
jgi:hypothetical protein